MANDITYDAINLCIEIASRKQFDFIGVKQQNISV